MTIAIYDWPPAGESLAIGGRLPEESWLLPFHATPPSIPGRKSRRHREIYQIVLGAFGPPGLYRTRNGNGSARSSEIEVRRPDQRYRAA